MIREKLTTDYGRSISYQTNVKEGQKMVVMFLHGYGGCIDTEVIQALMTELEEHNVGSLGFDWPAHGRSEAPDDDLTVENCLQDLDYMIGWIRERTDAPMACFSTSYGSYVGALYRSTHPDTFCGMILRSPALKMGELFPWFLTDEDKATLEAGGRIAQGFDRIMHIDKRFYESLLRHDAFNAPQEKTENMYIIQGDVDEIVHPEDTKAYAEKNGIEINLFEGTGHLYDNPGEKEKAVAVAKAYFLSKAGE